MGLLTQAKYFNGQTKYAAPEKYWYVKWIGRAVIIALLMAPFHFYKKYINDDLLLNPYAFFFLNKQIANTINPFLAFAFAD